jgi:hypothetical protein
MHCKYGSFNFHPWEASIGVHAHFKRSPRGFKLFQDLVFTFSGEIVESTAANIDARLAAMSQAFANDGQSCGLVHDNGTPTWHWMPSYADNPTNLTDVQVLSQTIPQSINGEFVSGRKFEFKVGSMYLTSPSAIIEFKETLERIGNAGPEFKWQRNKFWGWYPKLVSPNTIQVMTQSGYAIGVNNYLLPQPPIYAPPFEQNHLRRVKHTGPERWRKGHTGYKTEWLYVYHLPTFDDLTRPAISPVV